MIAHNGGEFDTLVVLIKLSNWYRIVKNTRNGKSFILPKVFNRNNENLKKKCVPQYITVICAMTGFNDSLNKMATPYALQKVLLIKEVNQEQIFEESWKD